MKKTVIAIFEDDKVDSFIYEKLFSHINEPVEIFLFDDPEKGYEVAKTIQFEIVIIDIHFWGDNLSGIRILKKLHEIYNKKIVAIAVTSLLQKGDLELILASGYTMCIEKPMVFKEISLLLADRNRNTK